MVMMMIARYFGVCDYNAIHRLSLLYLFITLSLYIAEKDVIKDDGFYSYADVL